MSPNATAILDILRESPWPLTRGEIVEAVDCPESVAMAALIGLVANGRVDSYMADVWDKTERVYRPVALHKNEGTR